MLTFVTVFSLGLLVGGLGWFAGEVPRASWSRRIALCLASAIVGASAPIARCVASAEAGPTVGDVDGGAR